MSSDYEQNIAAYVEKALSYPPGKQNFLVYAKIRSTLAPHFRKWCALVMKHAEKSDFKMIVLIRLLYIDGIPDRDTRHLTYEVFKDFCFWPGSVTEKPRRKDMENVIFWSENHIFMYLSSAYLYYQKVKGTYLERDVVVSEREVQHLRSYLNAHVRFNGVYEVLSAPYLPWTLCALLNLFDFAQDEDIKEGARRLIDLIVEQFMLAASSRGFCTLTASARQYKQYRLQNHSHHINKLVRLITGLDVDHPPPEAEDQLVVSPHGTFHAAGTGGDDMEERDTAIDESWVSTLGDFLVVSSWRPTPQALEAFHFTGFISARQYSHASHDVWRQFPEVATHEEKEVIDAALRLHQQKRVLRGERQREEEERDGDGDAEGGRDEMEQESVSLDITPLDAVPFCW
jgi:hypothetical protein